MTEPTTLALVRGWYEALGRGDLAAFSEMLADDVMWHEAGGAGNPYAGTYRGKAEMLGVLGRMAASGTAKLELQELYGDESRVVAIQGVTASRDDGRSFDSREAVILEVRDGLITSVYNLIDDPARLVEFWRD